MGRYESFVDRSTTVDRGDAECRWVVHRAISFTLNDNQTWFSDRHYVAVNFFNGLNINTNGVSDREACVGRCQQRRRPQLPGPDDGSQAIGTERRVSPDFCFADTTATVSSTVGH